MTASPIARILAMLPCLILSLPAFAQDKPEPTDSRQEEAGHPPGEFNKATDEIRAFLAGDWVSQDVNKNPLHFDKDGAFRFGFYPQDGKWVMAKGKWWIGEDGRVQARATSGGASIGVWYRIVGDELEAPLGANPKVIWKKLPAKAKTKPKPKAENAP